MLDVSSMFISSVVISDVAVMFILFVSVDILKVVNSSFAVVSMGPLSTISVKQYNFNTNKIVINGACHLGIPCTLHLNIH